MTLSLNSEAILDKARSVILRESEGITTLIPQLGPSLVEAAEKLLNCQGHVLVGGVGTSHAVALRFAHLLSCCGTPALFLHPGDGQHGLSGAVSSHDVVFLISKGGETSEVNHLAQVAKSRGAALIGLTEKPASTLGQMCDVVLCFQAPAENDPYGMIATGSSLFNSALCDALCVVLLELRGYTKEMFGATHPGGAVGIRIAEEKGSK
jgi:D-arabinose 5-phosphate isomerase GutQ